MSPLIEVDSDGVYWLLRAKHDNGQCVGAMQIRRWRECVCVGVAFGLLVAPEFRRQRVANMLMLRAEETARINGMSLLLATIRADNEASLSLVLSRGWHRTAEMRNPKSGADLYLYSKSIVGALRMEGEE